MKRASLALAFLPWLYLAGCARSVPMISTAKSAVSTIERSARAASDAFVRLDEITQGNIVAKADSLEAGQAKLESYREIRTPVFQAFALLYAAIAA